MSDRGQAGYWQRPVNRRRLVYGSATVVTGTIALGLVGCSGNGTGKQSPAATRAVTGAGSVQTAAAGPATPSVAATGSAGTPVPTGNFKTGGIIQGTIVTGTHLDPVANATYAAQNLAGFHYSRLFRFNSGPDPSVSLSREPIPDLVQGYEVANDGLTYTMHLRQGVNFHPPLSRSLTSADVKASWDYFTTSGKNVNKDVYAPIVDSITVPDATTLVFTLKQPYAPFLNKLANPAYPGILSQEAASGTIDPEQQAPGTGPWIYAGGTPTAYSWKRNPEYFIKGIPYADGTQLNIIADYTTQVAQFEAGKIDVVSVLPADVAVVQNKVPKATVVEYVPVGLGFLFFSNVQDPDSPFKDPRMRQAASVAVDRQRLIDDIYGHTGAVWQNIVPAGLGKWYLDPRSKAQGESAKWFSQDLKTAKQLLAATGHTTTEFTFLYTDNAYGPIFNGMARAVGTMLTDAGFKITVVTVDYLSRYIDSERGIFFKGAPANTIVFALQSAFTEPDDFLTGMLTKNGNRNHDLLDDPDLAALVQRQRVELDENKRLQFVFDIQRAHAEQMYYPPIVYTKAYIATRPWVQNFFVADDYNFGTEQYAYMSVNNR